MTQLEKIVEAAARYRSPGPEALAQCLDAIGERIVATGDELISTCASETALSVDRLTGERANREPAEDVRRSRPRGVMGRRTDRHRNPGAQAGP